MTSTYDGRSLAKSPTHYNGVVMALTKEQYFELYAEVVNRSLIAQRMNQLYTNLPAGAFKDTVKVTLKQDITDVLSARVTAGNDNIQNLQDSVVARTAQVTTEVIEPTQAQQSEVDDTNL